jgi:hypothetical protein
MFDVILKEPDQLFLVGLLIVVFVAIICLVIFVPYLRLPTIAFAAMMSFLMFVVLNDAQTKAEWMRLDKPVYDEIVQAPFTAHCGASGAIDDSPGVDRNCFDRAGLRVWVITGTDAAVTYYVGEKQPSGYVKKTMFFNPDVVLRYGYQANVWKDPGTDWNEYRKIFQKNS